MPINRRPVYMSLAHMMHDGWGQKSSAVLQSDLRSGYVGN